MASLQFAYRTQKAVNVFDAAPVYQQNAGFEKYNDASRCCAYSKCGRYFAWSSGKIVSVHEAPSGKALYVLPVPVVIEISFSPKGSFLITLERPGKDAAGDAAKNLKIWRTDDGVAGDEKKPVGTFVQKSHSDFNLQYTVDEKLCARMVNNEVQFFASDTFGAPVHKLRVEGVSQFSLSPGVSPSIAVFVPERKGQPAAVKVYNVPHFNSPTSQKTFFKGDKVKLSWNKTGSSILALAQTEVDKTNKSYYGESTLYLLSATGGFEGRVTLDKEGPIHHFDWNPNSKDFAVIYGFMPARAKIFNSRATPIHEFPTCPRNEIFFSPNGRFALVAGLGNLAGQIDIYDMERDYRKLCTIESGNPSVCEWSADSRYIMTATLSPRLRVDNGVKIWHVTGPLMYTEDMTELLQIAWRPVPAKEIVAGDPVSNVPAPHASAASLMATRKAPSKPAGAYRPPGARGMAAPTHYKREDEGGSSVVVNSGLSSGAGQNSLGGFGRPRRVIPGLEPAEPRVVPGAEPADDASGKKSKRKRTRKGGAFSEIVTPEPNCGVSLTSPANGNGSANANGNGNARSRSRNPPARNGGEAASPSTGAGAGAPTDPNTKKVRSLQKKLRAIEELEMRVAQNEKLEDTQMKKIATKDAVMAELNALGQ